jgi:hypothetical protein
MWMRALEVEQNSMASRLQAGIVVDDEAVKQAAGVISALRYFCDPGILMVKGR